MARRDFTSLWDRLFFENILDLKEMQKCQLEINVSPFQSKTPHYRYELKRNVIARKEGAKGK